MANKGKGVQPNFLAKIPGYTLLSEKMNDAGEKVSNQAYQSMDKLYSNILASPGMIIVILVIISGFFAQQAMTFQDQIEDDVEIFLPDGAESTNLLADVREEWSTDVTIIYVQTDNARLGGGLGDNITSEAVLRQMSWVEGDDENADQSSTQRGIDWNKNDYGREDGVLWIISPAQVIKEINSADGRFNNSLCEHGINTRIPVSVDCSLTTGGSYSIPDQDRIDQIIEQSNGAFDALVRDTNDNDHTVDSDGDGDYTNDMDGDGVWDTAAIVIGMQHDLSNTEFEEFSDLFIHIQNVMDSRDNTTVTTEMTLTGLSKVLEDVSDEIYQDLLKMLPWSLAFTVICITALHRSWKVVIITGTPIVMALAVTLGSTVLMNVTLTPMIVATFPILIGLGVDYALHMVNRIDEARRKEIDSIITNNEKLRRKGLPEDKVPDIWDLDLYKHAVLEMTRSTGVAVLLSAVTTVIGFSVLMAPTIVNVAPIRSVGLTLVLGIISTLFFSIFTVPTLAWILGYSKRTNPKGWSSVGRSPVKAWWIIILLAGSITAVGILNLEEMNEPITGTSEAPDGIESLNTLARYSQQFDGGQTSLYTFDATNRTNENSTTNIRDLPVLDELDRIENLVDQVEFTNTTSVVLFLKAIPVTIQLTDGVSLYEGSLWDLLHEECWESNDPVECNAWLLLEATGPEGREGLRRDMVSVVIDTLSEEVRSMLLNQGETKAIVYVTQPYLNLNYADGLRQEIDVILSEDTMLTGTQTTQLTGGLPVSLDINKGIHDTQTKTTILTLFVLLGVLMIMFRSVRLGIYTMLPVAVVILWQPLLMRSGDVNVNIFTAMIGTLVFGIGVDDAIHVMHRIQEEGETAVGLSNAVSKTGQTIFETSATTISGISAGFLAAFPGLENFFMMMVLLIAFAFLTSCFLLPATMTAEHYIMAKIRKEPNYIEFGDDFSIREKNQAMDADLS